MCARLAGADARAAAALRRSRHLSVPAAVLPRRRRRSRACARVAETLWTLGERVAQAAIGIAGDAARSSRSATPRSGWRASIPATRRPAPRRAPTRSSCPTRCSSPNTTASRRPAPATARGWPSCSTSEPVMARFRERFDARLLPAGRARCSRRWSRAIASGAAPRRRRGSRSSTGARCRPSASSRSCATRSSRSACRRSICDPRDLEYRRRRRSRAGSTRTASASTSSTAACSSTTSSRARPSAARCSTPTRRAPSASPTRCAARFRTRRRSSRC